MMKEGGKDINDILDMPFAFFMELEIGRASCRERV